MKKIYLLLVVVFGVVLLTGCGGSKKSVDEVLGNGNENSEKDNDKDKDKDKDKNSGSYLSCTAEYDGQLQELKLYFDSKSKVKTVDLIVTFDDVDTAEEAYDMYKLYFEGINISKSGKKLTIKGVEDIDGSDYANVVGMTKKEAREFVLDIEPDATCK